MTLKSLVTGVAAAAVMGGAAMGVTSIASPAIASADDCVDTGTLQNVLNTLIAPGVPFSSPGKSSLVEGGVGMVKGRLADGALRNAYADGTLPTTITVAPPTCSGNSATSVVSAAGKSMPITFVNEGTWKVSSGSAATVLAAFS
ncbi:hypothetical protein [Mycolicibacterium agri]|uniref:Low molecular weight antigen MTB12 n=1 Tax=Mycolicibacterium agri TaxID=36811 RepID=A0A7I9WCI7_MYCAG|nr:hypothetical protein [Mycolicibacterium agri]GFG54987.1 low molecular weight antigen MTB12 [Mycolicibacterium agri]